MQRFVLPHEEDDFLLYDAVNHHHKSMGYSNPKIACAFASVVADRIAKRFNKKSKRIVILYADGSSTILGWLVFIKLQQMGYKELEFRKSCLTMSYKPRGKPRRVCEGKRNDDDATNDIMDQLKSGLISTAGRDVFILIDDAVAIGRLGRSMCLAEERLIDLCYVMEVINSDGSDLSWRLPFKEVVEVRNVVDGGDYVYICNEYKEFLPEIKCSLPDDFDEHSTPGFNEQPLPTGVTTLSTVLKPKDKRVVLCLPAPTSKECTDDKPTTKATAYDYSSKGGVLRRRRVRG